MVTGEAEKGKVGEPYIVYSLNPSSIAEFFSSHQCPTNLIISNLHPSCGKSVYDRVSSGLLESSNDCNPFNAMNYLERKLGQRYESEVNEIQTPQL
jgi:hypothetical protein